MKGNARYGKQDIKEHLSKCLLAPSYICTRKYPTWKIFSRLSQAPPPPIVPDSSGLISSWKHGLSPVTPCPHSILGLLLMYCICRIASELSTARSLSISANCKPLKARAQAFYLAVYETQVSRCHWCPHAARVVTGSMGTFARGVPLAS